MIRYLIINCLKLNFLSATILAASSDRTQTEFITAIVIFVFINSMPLVFCFILRRHHKTLADHDNIASFGTLYTGRNVTDVSHKAHFLPLTFFYRRAIFILVTVHFFKHPSLQFISCHVITILTIVYLASNNRTFSTQA